MAWGIGDIFKAMSSGMKDDKGLFQGGEEGRGFGRLRDRLEGKATSYDPSMEEDRITSQHARDFAKNMDVGSEEDVFEMQNMLNQLGFKDYEGKELSTDSMMGDRTLSALRQLQDDDASGADEQQGPGPWAYGDEGSAPRSWINKLFGGAGKDTRDARNSLFERTYDTSPDAYKKGGSLMFQRKGGTGPKQSPGY